MIISYKVPPFSYHHMNDPGSIATIDKPQIKYPLCLLSMDYLRLQNLDLNPLVYDTHTLSLNVHKQSKVKLDN